MSFNIDVDALMSGAASMFNALWPIFAVIVGLALGIKIVQLVRKEITGSF
jgi:hypothetical protein